MNKAQIADLFKVIERAGPNGLRLVYRNLEDSAYIVAYEPPESVDEAGELPIGFVTLYGNGEASVVASPSPAGTPDVDALKTDLERRETLGALIGQAERERGRPRG